MIETKRRMLISWRWGRGGGGRGIWGKWGGGVVEVSGGGGEEGGENMVGWAVARCWHWCGLLSRGVKGAGGNMGGWIRLRGSGRGGLSWEGWSMMGMVLRVVA